MNSELVGYFDSKKGLRQWDSTSPYLFVIVMNLFSIIDAKTHWELYPKCALSSSILVNVLQTIFDLFWQA